MSAITRASIFVGVAGGTASGKTTVVERLVEWLGRDRAGAIAHDRYYRDRSDLPDDARPALNYDHPDALETELLLSHLEALGAGRTIDAPVYDFARHARAARTEAIHPRAVIFVEGLLVLADARLRDVLHLRVFVDTDERTRYARRLERDLAERGRTVESVARQFTRTVQPMHAAFVEPSRAFADCVVTEGGFNDRALRAVWRRILRLAAT